MKLKSFWLAFLLLASGSQASPWTYRVDLSSANILATFAASPQLTGPNIAFLVVRAQNNSAFDFEINCARTTVPSSSATNSEYVLAFQSIETPILFPQVMYPLSKVCWIRSVSGTANAGTLTVTGYGY